MSTLQVQVKCLLTSRGCGAAEAGYMVLGPTEEVLEGPRGALKVPSRMGGAY